MTDYLGNASLSSAVKERVLSTFQQTLTLYKQGRMDEVIQGCGLILRMDPMFDPAKKLLEKAKNPSAAIDVDALAPQSAGGDGNTMADAHEAMAARDFQRVVNITTEILTNDLLNDDARILNEQAREKMEAAPFIEQFVRKFDQQLASGNLTSARAELEKARALDDGHPAVAKMESALAASKPAQPAPSSSGFDASTSFVVDNPPPSPTGRGTAQASDFGFTFEEEKPGAAAPPVGGAFSFDTPAQPSGGSGLGGFSFDTPSSPSPAPAADAFASFGSPSAGSAQTFDFSTAPIDTNPEDQAKIKQYLADGDRAFDGGDYQQAIDLWSRIFLIDVTNDEASQRIEKAKAKRREIEQKVESILAAGIAAYDKHDNVTARAKFEEVLRADPGNNTAQEYLDRMSNTVAEGGASAFSAPYIPPSAVAEPDLFAEELGEPSGTAALIPPEPATAKAAAPAAGGKKAAPAKAKTTKSVGVPKNLIFVIVAAIVVIGGGWFAWSKFMSKPAYDTAATSAIIKQANTLAQTGKYDQAIAMLQDVKSEDPQYHTAAALIADLQKKKTQAAEMVEGRPAAVVYQEYLANGKQAFSAHDYDAAKKAFDSAARIKAIPDDLRPMYDQASQQVAKLDSAKGLFKEQKYADAISNLQPLLQADPQNQSIRRIITDAHFDMGATALQDERTADAIKEFDEVLQTDPNDELAKRSKALAERYNGQPKDLLYKMYVKYLPLRLVS